MAEPPELLDIAFQRASRSLNTTFLEEESIRSRIEYVARNLKNRAAARLLLACLLAKVHRPEFDIRKPYTEIGTVDSYSGRTYDERYISQFIGEHSLPCNSTTAFLTPAFRNRNATLTTDVDLVGRPPQLYEAVLLLLDDVFQTRVEAEDLLIELIRMLIILRDERGERIRSLIQGLTTTDGGLPLSSEQIVSLIGQHLQFKGTSRLPVLMVAAAYQVAQDLLCEQVLTLHSHNAADIQTGALGDIEIVLRDGSQVVTSYEMKDRRVGLEDVKRAVQKVAVSAKRIDNYIFITTDSIDERVEEYARSLYEETGGIEFVILDCIGFLRHFLHLFHRVRTQFLEAYQVLILAEPESAVSQPVKEAFLAMRQAAESEE